MRTLAGVTATSQGSPPRGMHRLKRARPRRGKDAARSGHSPTARKCRTRVRVDDVAVTPLPRRCHLGATLTVAVGCRGEAANRSGGSPCCSAQSGSPDATEPGKVSAGVACGWLPRHFRRPSHARHTAGGSRRPEKAMRPRARPTCRRPRLQGTRAGAFEPAAQTRHSVRCLAPQSPPAIRRQRPAPRAASRANRPRRRPTPMRERPSPRVSRMRGRARMHLPSGSRRATIRSKTPARSPKADPPPFRLCANPRAHCAPSRA